MSSSMIVLPPRFSLEEQDSHQFRKNGHGYMDYNSVTNKTSGLEDF
jgi:hypothetical protein